MQVELEETTSVLARLGWAIVSIGVLVSFFFTSLGGIIWLIGVVIQLFAGIRYLLD